MTVHLDFPNTVVAVLLGGLHALEPGHGKVALLVYLSRGGRSLRTPLVVAATSALAHSASILVIAILTHAATSLIAPVSGDAFFLSLELLSGIIVMAVALRLLRAKTVRHGACCSCHGEHRVDAIRRRDAGWRTDVALGLGTGLLPCPSALAAYLGGVSAGDPWSGYISILSYAVGIIVALSAFGALVIVAGRRVASVHTIERHSRAWGVLSAAIMMAIGAIYAANALSHLAA